MFHFQGPLHKQLTYFWNVYNLYLCVNTFGICPIIFMFCFWEKNVKILGLYKVKAWKRKHSVFSKDSQIKNWKCLSFPSKFYLIVNGSSWTFEIRLCSKNWPHFFFEMLWLCENMLVSLKLRISLKRIVLVSKTTFL